jgi:hypothetical protein
MESSKETEKRDSPKEKFEVGELVFNILVEEIQEIISPKIDADEELVTKWFYTDSNWRYQLEELSDLHKYNDQNANHVRAMARHLENREEHKELSFNICTQTLNDIKEAPDPYLATDPDKCTDCKEFNIPGVKSAGLGSNPKVEAEDPWKTLKDIVEKYK